MCQETVGTGGLYARVCLKMCSQFDRNEKLIGGFVGGKKTWWTLSEEDFFLQKLRFSNLIRCALEMDGHLNFWSHYVQNFKSSVSLFCDFNSNFIYPEEEENKLMILIILKVLRAVSCYWKLSRSLKLLHHHSCLISGPNIRDVFADTCEILISTDSHHMSSELRTNQSNWG